MIVYVVLFNNINVPLDVASEVNIFKDIEKARKCLWDELDIIEEEEKARGVESPVRVVNEEDNCFKIGDDFSYTSGEIFEKNIQD